MRIKPRYEMWALRINGEVINEVIVKGTQIKVNGVWFINRDKFVEKFKKWASSGTRIIDGESVCRKLNELIGDL